jgi:hypothetical protein
MLRPNTCEHELPETCKIIVCSNKSLIDNWITFRTVDSGEQRYWTKGVLSKNNFQGGIELSDGLGLPSFSLWF